MDQHFAGNHPPPNNNICGGGGGCFNGFAGSLVRWKQMKRLDQVNYDDYSELIAAELNSLSFHEREKIIEEVHGVADIADETPEFIAASIDAFDQELKNIPRRKRRALDRALFLKPSIETDTKFKLLFLRTDYFDAHRAAQRMAQYFEFKRSWFGEDKLVKDLTLDDLDEQGIDALFRSTCYVGIPSCDQTGRPILFFDFSKFDFRYRSMGARALWYLYMITVQENELASKLGICLVLYCPGTMFGWSDKAMYSNVAESFVLGGKFFSSVPMRCASFHCCYKNEALKTLLYAVKIGLNKDVRLRIRVHVGSDVEIQYELMTFGIDCNGLLAGDDDNRGKHTENDKVKRAELCDAFLNRRREIELQQLEEKKRQEAETGIVLEPNPNDVLVGRGVPYQEFSGNRRHQVLVEQAFDEYRKCKARVEKTSLFMRIVMTIRELGGRFLSRTAGGWKVVSDQEAYEKTATAFRSKKSILNKQSKNVAYAGVVRDDIAFDDYENSDSTRSKKRLRSEHS